MNRIPTIALRPPVQLPPKRRVQTDENRCTACGHVISPTGECIGCSE